jgi:hypothetical protein
MTATPATPAPTAAENAFVTRVSHELLAAYPTTAHATAHGYMQMTKLESDNTIIYSDMKFDGITETHPNFLWYDRHGKLVGLDYEYPVSTTPKFPGPSVYPVAPARWTTVHEHVHFAYQINGGPIVRKGARAQANLKSGAITAAELTADGLLPKGATLVWADYHPTCWDLGFFVVPDPDGAFADPDPLVK